MKANNTLTIFVTPLKGEEIQIEKVCTPKQAVTLAKKEARKLINNGGMWVTINIQARASYGVETLAHIEAEKEGRRVAFSDEQPTETYAVCWGDEYKEEDGENNAIAEVNNEEEAKAIAENESVSNNCVMSVVRKSDRKTIAIYNNTPETPNPENNTPATMNANENEYLDRLRAELQEYHNNASKGGANRQRNMAMLAEDIALLEASANEITVTVHQVAPGHWQASANGVKFGWVCTWDHGTFAACMNIGIREQKALAPLDLWNEQRGSYGHKTESAAVASLSEMMTSYFAKYGYTAKVLNA